MNQTITIDDEPYEVDHTVAGLIDDMRSELESLRAAPAVATGDGEWSITKSALLDVNAAQPVAGKCRLCGHDNLVDGQCREEIDTANLTPMDMVELHQEFWDGEVLRCVYAAAAPVTSQYCLPAKLAVTIGNSFTATLKTITRFAVGMKTRMDSAAIAVTSQYPLRQRTIREKC